MLAPIAVSSSWFASSETGSRGKGAAGTVNENRLDSVLSFEPCLDRMFDAGTVMVPKSLSKMEQPGPRESCTLVANGTATPESAILPAMS